VAGIFAIILAPVAVLAGRAARLPSIAIWPVAVGFAAAGTVSRTGMELYVYMALIGVMLLVANRFAALAVDLSAFCLPDDEAAGRRTLHTTTLADPVAREFARARRDESQLAVATIAVPNARGASRRLARIASELVPSLRRTDAIVRAVANRLVVVLPGGDHQVAMAVLNRVLTRRHPDVLVGIATFPHDAPTWGSLKDVAREREQPWPGVRRPQPVTVSQRFTRDGAPETRGAPGARSVQP
jgi:hypothetical protein